MKKLPKNDIKVDSLKDIQEEIIKNNRLISKSQQRCKSMKIMHFWKKVKKGCIENYRWSESTINQLNRDICIWNDQRPNMVKWRN